MRRRRWLTTAGRAASAGRDHGVGDCAASAGCGNLALCNFRGRDFSSQTKEVLTSKVSCKLDDAFLKKVVTKLDVVNKVLEAQDAKDAKDMKKTDGKKQSRLTGLPKLDDAFISLNLQTVSFLSNI